MVGHGVRARVVGHDLEDTPAEPTSDHDDLEAVTALAGCVSLFVAHIADHAGALAAFRYVSTTASMLASIDRLCPYLKASPAAA